MDSLFKRQAFPSHDGRVARRVLVDGSPSVLRRWRERDVGLVLWQRTWDQALVRRLDSLRVDELPEACFIAHRDDAEVAVEAALSASPLRDETLLGALAADMESLISRFAAATVSDEIEVRLEPMMTNAFGHFRTDAATACLVTTYIGPGTAWVPDCHGREALSLQEDYRGPLCEMGRFAVGLFKGSRSQGGGLVHRLPRLAESDRLRLSLCLNAPHAGGTPVH